MSYIWLPLTVCLVIGFGLFIWGGAKLEMNGIKLVAFVCIAWLTYMLALLGNWIYTGGY